MQGTTVVANVTIGQGKTVVVNVTIVQGTTVVNETNGKVLKW